MNKLNTFLRSEAATLTLLALALLAQMPHAATVFQRLSGVQRGDGSEYWLSVVHASAYAFALEMATLVFVVRGQRKMAYIFAGASIAVNIAYYEIWTLQMWQVAQVLLISIVLPYAIAAYSHDAADKMHGNAPGAKDATQPTPAEVQRKPAQATQKPAAQRNAPKATAPKAKPAAPPSDAKAQALQMADEGMRPAEIARLLNAKPSTVASWVRRSKQAQPAHSNGTNGATPE